MSRESRRKAARRGGGLEYRANTPHWDAEQAVAPSKVVKLAVHAVLCNYVQPRLSGRKTAPGGTLHLPVLAVERAPSYTPANETLVQGMSPQQIAQRVRIDFSAAYTMRISHEANYQTLFVQGRGALTREMTACSHMDRALRVPRALTRGRGKSLGEPQVMIGQRPAEATGRAVPG